MSRTALSASPDPVPCQCVRELLNDTVVPDESQPAYCIAADSPLVWADGPRGRLGVLARHHTDLTSIHRSLTEFLADRPPVTVLACSLHTAVTSDPLPAPHVASTDVEFTAAAITLPSALPAELLIQLSLGGHRPSDMFGRVNSVGLGRLAPGRCDASDPCWFDRSEARSRSVPTRRLTTDAEVRSAVDFLLSDRSSYLFGQTLRLDGLESVPT